MYNLDEIKIDLEKLLLKAGKIIQEGFTQRDKKVKEKLDKNDLVTCFDIKVNNLILDHLKKRYPKITIVSEEADDIEKQSNYSFVVDPIDGTNNFVRGIPTFFVGIVLAKDKKPILALTLNPITKELFWAIKGKGSYLNDKQIKVSDRNLTSSNVNLEIVRLPKIKKEVVSNLFDNIHIIRTDTCLHYAISNVASARYDASISKGLFVWDYAQALLAQEAGGKATNWQGEEFDITKKDLIVSNGLIHGELIEILNSKKP